MQRQEGAAAIERAEATVGSNAPVALVTGGARGLGLACALRLAAEGFRIALVDIDAQALRTALEQLPGGSESHAYAVADVTRASQVRAAVDDVSDRVGAPSALINAAGILRSTRFLDISEAEWDAVMDVSVKGTFLACQACIPMMRRSAHGRIVIFSSTAGKSVSTLGGAHGLPRILVVRIPNRGRERGRPAGVRRGVARNLHRPRGHAFAVIARRAGPALPVDNHVRPPVR